MDPAAIDRLTLEQLKSFVLRLRCPKIDMEDILRCQRKEDLLQYLHSRRCPGVKMMERLISEQLV